MPKLILPSFYYHDHFLEMLDSIERVYLAMLDNSHHAFIQGFRQLSRDGQCLYIRMTNRKGRIFHRTTLHYEEIDADARHELQRSGFARAVIADDYQTLLATMAKDELVTLARKAELTEWKVSWVKARLAGHLHQALPYERFCTLATVDDYLVQEHSAAVDFLIYLYFGKTHDDLKSFALRDLKLIPVQDKIAVTARFADAAEARACFLYSSLLKDKSFEHAAEVLASAPPAPSVYAQSLKDKLIYKTGQFFEARRDFPRAIALYQLSDSPECNERLIRLLYAQGDKMAAKSRLEAMIDDPASDEEYDFASDFYSRKFDRQRIGHCTALLRGSVSIAIDDSHRQAPEAGAVSYFRRDGWRAYHTENCFWQTLFGLLFWDELFGGATLHSGFDRVPHCLKNNSFAQAFAPAIATKLDAVRQKKGLPLLLKTIAAACGQDNGVFSWEMVQIEALKDFLRHADPQAVTIMLALMCNNYNSLCDGFPDLMLIKNGAVKFVEIKAEGDAIRRHQLTRLRQLQQAGFTAEICRVNYQYDPQQIYAVVDIETTGGRASNERITEIGAVKIQNHQIIGEWHSLLNPQRPIPAFITQLTGITNAMVKDAPLFAEIADDLAAFLGDAVFVAHNVNFDYGFIAAEYRRLDRTFRAPKLCTVASMRRHYPGQDSYSLGALCYRYAIPLPTHHRALCDAQAAGQLLMMVNRRREERAAFTEPVKLSA